MTKKEKIATLPYSNDGKEYQWVWISNHWDIHLSGIVRYKGEICEFITDDQTIWSDEEDDWVGETFIDIFSLTPKEKFNWLRKKFLFEKCVGYHWSYPERKNGYNFHIRNPNWLYKFLFNFHYYKFKFWKYRK